MHGTRMRAAWRVLVLLSFLTLGLNIAVAPAGADPAAVGAWSAPFQMGQIGIHSTLLRNGKVLYFGYTGALGTEARVWDPATGAITNVALTRKRDLFCSGHSVLSDGRVFVTGGTVWGQGMDLGVRATDFFDPVTNTWTKGPSMTRPRWYPTNVQLPNGRTLIFSGQRDDYTVIKTVESYDPQTNTITELPSTATRRMDLYPRMHVTADGKVFWANEDLRSFLFDPATNTWKYVDDLNVGRWEAPSVLLPGNKVLVIGGEWDRVTKTAEIIDMNAATPTWKYTGSMTYARKHHNAVQLPDGKVLVVGGGTGSSYTNPVKTAEMYDPATGTFGVMAAQQAPRMYHSTALLLPDGRVLSAGQDSGTFRSKGEIYSPPYLFKGPRPAISSAPATLGYNQGFAIDSPEAGDIAKVALIRPGSVTHNVNMEQRYVPVSFAEFGGTLLATSPANARLAPPGWYMLFVVNSAGVPSVASWVHVG